MRQVAAARVRHKLFAVRGRRLRPRGRLEDACTTPGACNLFQPLLNGGVEFRALGPLEVIEDGRPCRLGSRKERALLALLVIDAGRAVPRDRIIEELWHPVAGSVGR
jgi:hypothetical protein